MSSTHTVTQTKKVRAYGFKMLAGEPDGTFEAIVSVFNNVDYANERVIADAFDASLARWKASGDPIPVIFSHQWDNLDAHVGIVVEAAALRPGDARLPLELANLGGLYVKARLSLDEPFAARLWGKMAQRAIREFSFAYDVLKARPGADGALDLTELDVIEVGPTLKGMNPLTELLAVKARGSKTVDPMAVLEEADVLRADLGLKDGAELHVELNTDSVLDHSKAAPARGAKRLPTMTGSMEEYRDTVHASAEVWAMLEYGRDLYKCHLEATFPQECKALVTAERWEDPLGEGPVWELSYSMVPGGSCNIDGAQAMELNYTLEPAKARAAAALKDAGRLFAKLSGAKDSDADVGALVSAIDATVDEALEAYDSGDADSGRSLLTAVDVTVDELMDELGLVDPDEDETVEDDAAPMPNPMPSPMPMMSSTSRGRRAGRVPTQARPKTAPAARPRTETNGNGTTPGVMRAELEAAAMGIDL
jgi:hypothetical protein